MDIEQKANEVLVTHKHGIIASFLGILLLLSLMIWAGAKYDKSSPVPAPRTPDIEKVAK